MASCIDCKTVLESAVTREGRVILRCKPCHERMYGPVLLSREPKPLDPLSSSWLLLGLGFAAGVFVTVLACYLFGS